MDLTISSHQLERVAAAGGFDRGRYLKRASLNSLSTFGELVDRNWRAARVHQLICEKLEAVAAGKIKRLAVSMPPGHGKSDLISIKFPAWLFTKDPRHKIIHGAYNAELTEEFSHGIRSIMEGPRYLRYFDPILYQNSRIKTWRTTRGGQYFATSVGGGGVGRRANTYIVDDPIKNRAEANSGVYREALWKWFISSARTRLFPGGAIIVIQTRWHEDDLIGRLTDPSRQRALRDAGLDEYAWEELRLEGLCENPDTDPLGRKFGEALWPEKWGVRELQALKIEIGPYEFNSQVQQRPAPPGGNLCDIKKIKIIKRDEVPAHVSLARGWDLAISEETSADYSCGAFGGTEVVTMRDADGHVRRDVNGNEVRVNRVYLVHMDRKKRQWPEQKRAMLHYAAREADGGKIGVEATRGWEVAAQELREVLRGRTKVVAYRPNIDKQARAQPWLNVIDAGEFYMVENSTWNQDFLDELEQFPNGTHDDQIDAVTVLWEMMHKKKRLMIA